MADPRQHPGWLKLGEVADALHCSVEQVRQLCLSGKLPCVSIGLGERKRYRVHYDALQRFLRSREQQAAAKPVKAPSRSREKNLLGL